MLALEALPYTHLETTSQQINNTGTLLHYKPIIKKDLYSLLETAYSSDGEESLSHVN